MAFPVSVKDVEFMVVGNKRVITPAGQVWDDWFNDLGVSIDFMECRKQPEDQMRESL